MLRYDKEGRSLIWALLLLLVASSIAVKEEGRLEIDEMVAVEKIVVTDEALVLVGTRESYLVSQGLSRRWEPLWLSTLSFPGKVSLLELYSDGKSAYAIVAVKGEDHYVAKVRIGPRSEVEKTYPIFPRLFPMSAVDLGGSIFIAGSHLTIFEDVDYMIARLDERGPVWIIEDKGGRGNEHYKCLFVTPNGRLLAIGDNGEIIVVTLLNQLGGLVANYTIKFSDPAMVLDCQNAGRGEYLISGTLAGLPLIIWLPVSGSSIEAPRQLVIGDLKGVATNSIEVGNATISFIATEQDNMMLLIDSRDQKILGHWNLSWRGGPILSSAFWDGILVIGGKGKAGGEARALSFLLLDHKEESGILARLSQPGLTLLLLLLVAISAIIAYKRRASANISR